MLKQPVNVRDVETLAKFFRQYPEIQAVYIFGSVASGKTHSGSDLDLAILCRGESLREKKLELLTELARLGFCNVDLILLNSADIILQYEAIRQNRLIYSTEEFDRGAVYSKIVRLYLDFQPYLQVQRQAYKRRLEHD